MYPLHRLWRGFVLEVEFTSSVAMYGWNAIWLYGVNDDGFNNEIDLIEHYGAAKNKKGIGETNLHWGDYEDNHNVAGAVPITCTDKATIKNGRIRLDWTDESEIKIYYNDTLVRRIVDEKVLDDFYHSKMMLRLTAGVMDGSEQSAYSSLLVSNIWMK